jgi:hypothetical protein
MEETHDDVIREKGLPRVGQIIRNRKYGTLWRVIEKKEVYQNTADDMKTGQPRMFPAINLVYRRFNVEKRQEMEDKLGYTYTLHDNTFELNWEIVDERKSLHELAGSENLSFNREVFDTNAIR